MRVALVSHGSAPGGAERALLELIDGLRQQGVICCVLLRKRDWFVGELNRRNVPFAVIPYRWWSSDRPYWRGMLKNLLALSMLLPVSFQLKRWKVDVILTNTCAVPAGALAAFLLRKPHVWHIHEFGKEDHGLSYDLGIWLSTKLITYFSAFVIANSHAVETYYARYIPRSRIRMIYQGVDMHAEVATDQVPETKSVGGNTPVKLVLVGLIKDGKGQTEAVQALGQLIGQGAQVELNLVGTGIPSDLGKVKSVVSRGGLEKFVHFTGQVQDPSAIVKGSNIALMCSRSEAFGRSTVEAMKLGKPVVGARGGATPELIRDNFNGLLYTPGDYLDLAQKIKFLMDNPELAKQMGENGRRWAQEEFTVEKYAGRVLRVLEEALQQSAA